MKKTITALSLLSGLVAVLSVILNIQVLFNGNSWFFRFAMFSITRGGGLMGYLGKLMSMLAEKSPKLHVWTEQSSLMVGLSTNDAPQNPKLDKNNWLPAFTQALERFKNDGFDRVNPSILKATIQADYPDFDEKQIGFKRFSDVMKALEKQKLLVVEMDEAHTMLLKIC